MGSKHIIETLNEANKKISQIIDKMQDKLSTNAENEHRKIWIDDLNTIIRQLDHIVENLEKRNK